MKVRGARFRLRGVMVSLLAAIVAFSTVAAATDHSQPMIHQQEGGDPYLRTGPLRGLQWR